MARPSANNQEYYHDTIAVRRDFLTVTVHVDGEEYARMENCRTGVAKEQFIMIKRYLREVKILPAWVDNFKQFAQWQDHTEYTPNPSTHD